ncbi:hypothetical protein BDZ91DRAFT_765044 [Kalaharituber pfeilii]|nr:hypothetical protein BDZ91DRAFT_765044 [Kalaharituber pfeilii]
MENLNELAIAVPQLLNLRRGRPPGSTVASKPWYPQRLPPFDPDRNGDGDSDLIRPNGKWPKPSPSSTATEPEGDEVFSNVHGPEGGLHEGGEEENDPAYPTATEMDIHSNRDPGGNYLDDPDSVSSSTTTTTTTSLPLYPPPLEDPPPPTRDFPSVTDPPLTGSKPTSTLTTTSSTVYYTVTKNTDGLWTNDIPTVTSSCTGYCLTASAASKTSSTNGVSASPWPAGADINKDSRELIHILGATGKLVLAIVLTTVLSLLIAGGTLWACKWRKKRRGVGNQRTGEDVEGGGVGRKRKLWAGVRKRKAEKKLCEKANAAGVVSTSQPTATATQPEMAQPSRAINIIQPIPPHHSNHRPQHSSTTLLARPMSISSSLTVPPYSVPPSSSGTTRSNSTRTANSVASNTTDDTVLRAKREYQTTVSRFADVNMRHPAGAVADGFRCAPPNPFDDGAEGPGQSPDGMGGPEVGVSGMDIVDAQGNRAAMAMAPPRPPLRRTLTRMSTSSGVLNPFEEAELEGAIVADGFRPDEAGAGPQLAWAMSGSRTSGGRNARPPRPPPPPPRAVEDPFADDVGTLAYSPYAHVHVEEADGFDGGHGTIEEEYEESAGDAESFSSGETLREDVEGDDWGGGGGGAGAAGHAGRAGS